MNKNSIKLMYHIDNEIQFGDTIKIYDGSGLTLHEEHPKSNDTYYLITDSYPEITGSNKSLKNIIGYVIETGVKDRACISTIGEYGYVQDVVVKLGNAKFRTCSKFLLKVEDHV